MPPSHRPPSLATQLVDLCLIELTNWRWSWRSILITSTITPLLAMIALGVFARDAGPQALAYVLTGNVVLSLMFGTLNNVQSHIVYLRFMGTLDYFASLPVHKQALVLAIVFAFILINLPSLIVTVLAGSLLLGVPLDPHPMVLLVVPLAAIPLAGLGALIGAGARTPEEGGALSLLLTLALLGLGPVVIPPDRLPALLLALGRLSPATYAASALRQTLLGPVTGQLLIDLTLLLGFGALLFWLTGRKLDWRQT